MHVFRHGRLQRRGRCSAGQRGLHRSFKAAPAVIAAAHDAIHLFPRMRAHVSQPELTGRAVERPAPRIAEAPGEDLRAILRARSIQVAQGIRRERVVGRNSIATGSGAAADVDAQDLAKQVVGELSIAGDSAGAVVIAAVADAEIEEAIRAKQQVAAIVVAAGLRHLEHDLLRGGIQRRAAVGRDEFRNAQDDDARAHLVGIRRVGARVGGIVGMKGQPQQAVDVAEDHPVADVEHVAGGRHGRRVRERHHVAILLHGDPAAGVVRNTQQRVRGEQCEVWERALGGDSHRRRRRWRLRSGVRDGRSGGCVGSRRGVDGDDGVAVRGARREAGVGVRGGLHSGERGRGAIAKNAVTRDAAAVRRSRPAHENRIRRLRHGGHARGNTGRRRIRRLGWWWRVAVCGADAAPSAPAARRTKPHRTTRTPRTPDSDSCRFPICFVGRRPHQCCAPAEPWRRRTKCRRMAMGAEFQPASSGSRL